MAYTGHRYVLPGRNTNDFVHGVKGTVGVYSHWPLYADTQLLEDAPLEDVEPGKGKFPGHPQRSQQFTGEFSYKPMNLSKFSPHGQDVPYMRHAIFEHHGVISSDVFPADFGHDGSRELYYSAFHNVGGLGVDSQFELDGGHPVREYGSGAANFGRVENYNREGQLALSDPGELLATKQADPRPYGHEQVRVHFGVPSSKAL